jgi:hypothetical protein
MQRLSQRQDDEGTEGVKRKPAVKPRGKRIRIWTVYGAICCDGWKHQVVEMVGIGNAIVKVHATFDHLGAARSYERSLRAFLKEQSSVRAS